MSQEGSYMFLSRIHTGAVEDVQKGASKGRNVNYQSNEVIGTPENSIA